MPKIITCLTLLLVVSACAATPDYSFNPATDGALVLVKTPKSLGGSVLLQEVDLQEEQFTNQLYVVRIGGIASKHLRPPGDERTRGELFAQKVKPGKYAVVARYPDGTTHVCFSRGTYVFEIQPGKVSIIPVQSNFLNPAETIASAKELLKNYPNIVGKVVVPKPVARVTFDAFGFWSTCPSGKKLQVEKYYD